MVARRRAGSDPARTLLDRVSNGVSADVRLVHTAWTTVRFANGRIHQPHFETASYVSLRVADEGRLGTATTTDLSAEGLSDVATAAKALARIAPKEARFPGFPSEGRAVRPVAFSKPTAALGPDAVCRLAEQALHAAAEASPGARIAGAVNVGFERLRVVNSEGLDRSTSTSAAQASVLAERPERDPPVSGWSEGAHWDVARLDPATIGREAGERVAASPPASMPPGKYPVVLRGPAVAEALAFLAYLGFGGFPEVDGSSCLRAYRGRRLAPSSVSLLDDPRSRDTIPQAVDYEGLPTRPTPLLKAGRVGPAVRDLLTAGRLRRPPTGHGLPPEAPWGEFGPVPSHLLLAPGSASEEELVRETRRGLLVTRFHYVRTVDPGEGTITGMTRDGTYRIERGEIAGPVKNLRFTESVRSMMAGVTGIGRVRRIYSDERGRYCQTVPDLSVRAFRFTSATLF